jgi:hypothetical protein
VERVAEGDTGERFASPYIVEWPAEERRNAVDCDGLLHNVEPGAHSSNQGPVDGVAHGSALPHALEHA